MTHQAMGHQASSAQAVKYTVRSGDSLSAIAGRFYHKQSAWPVLYWANRDKIHWANTLDVGEVLRIPAEPAKIPSAPGQLGPAAPAPAAAAPGQHGVRARAVHSRGGERVLGRHARRLVRSVRHGPRVRR